MAGLLTEIGGEDLILLATMGTYRFGTSCLHEYNKCMPAIVLSLNQIKLIRPHALNTGSYPLNAP